jgi:exopolysaccharide biosynthesis polyprenyl glycosylphosphotransferase
VQTTILSQTPAVEFMAELSAELKLRRGWRNSLLSVGELRRLYILTLIMSDGLMLGLGFFWAYQFRFASKFFLFQINVAPTLTFYAQIVLGLIPLWLMIFALFGLYNCRHLLGGVGEYTRIFHASTAGLLVVVFVTFIVEDFIIARGWLISAWLFNFVLIVGTRFWLRRVVYALRRHGYFLTPTLIVGGNGEASLLAHQLSHWPTSGLNLLGFVSDKLPPGQRVIRNFYSLGPIKDLPKLVERYGVEELILAPSDLTQETILEVFQRYGFSDRVNIWFSSGLFEIMTTGLQVKELAYTPLIAVNQVRLTGLEHFLKTMMDYILAILGLILLSPVILLIAILIRLDSSGPVFYRRRVMGVGGHEFYALKFRTMYVDGDQILAQYPALQAKLAAEHKLKDDPRVTHLGRFLRRLSLDELPQLFNVLRGQMSLIGPRIISPEELVDYGQWEMNLLTVKPGLTGLWQISGRSNLSYEERVKLDMHYIRNYSIWLDIFIIWRTIPTIWKGRGAY